MRPPERRAVPTEIRTPRLLLRCPRSGDGQALHDAIHASAEHLRPWMHWAQDPGDVASYEANVRRAASRFVIREELRYLMFSADGTTLLGSTGFHTLDWRVPKAEIGYWISAAHAGRGLVTEAVDALVTTGFEELGFQRIEVRCDARNERSARVPRRLGLPLEGVLRNDDVAAHDPNELRDTLLFAVTPDAWAPRRRARQSSTSPTPKP